MSITIKYNADAAIALLDGIRERTIDMTPAMKGIQQVMLQSATQNFIDQGRPARWVPLAEATIRRRRNQNRSSIEILGDTGYLKRSLSPSSSGSIPEGGIRRHTKQSSHIGTNRPGAANHQRGYTVPRRPFLLHQQQDRLDYRSIIITHVTGKFTTGA